MSGPRRLSEVLCCRKYANAHSVAVNRLNIGSRSIVARLTFGRGRCRSNECKATERPDQESDTGSVVCLFGRNGVAAALTSGIDPWEVHADPSCVCRLLKNGVTGPLDTWRRDLHYRNL